MAGLLASITRSGSSVAPGAFPLPAIMRRFDRFRHYAHAAGRAGGSWSIPACDTVKSEPFFPPRRRRRRHPV